MALLICKTCGKEYISRSTSKYCSMKCVHSNADYKKNIGEKSLGNKHRFTKGHEFPSELYQSRIYRIWSNMISRCDNKNVSCYKRYGARGITYQESWRFFDCFYKDMSPNYKDELTLDRIDNNGNYCKENCKWSTLKEQANNTRNIERANKFTYKDISKTIKQWSDFTGIKKSTLYMRLVKYNWPIEKAITLGV